MSTKADHPFLLADALGQWSPRAERGKPGMVGEAIAGRSLTGQAAGEHGEWSIQAGDVRLDWQDVLRLSQCVYNDPDFAASFRFASAVLNHDKFADADPLAPGFEWAEPDLGESDHPTAAERFAALRLWALAGAVEAGRASLAATIGTWLRRSCSKVYAFGAKVDQAASEMVIEAIDAASGSVSGLTGGRVAGLALGDADAAWGVTCATPEGGSELMLRWLRSERALCVSDPRDAAASREPMVAIRLDRCEVIPAQRSKDGRWLVKLDRLANDGDEASPEGDGRMPCVVMPLASLQQALRDQAESVLSGHPQKFRSDFSDLVALYAQVIPDLDEQRRCLLELGQLDAGSRSVLRDTRCLVLAEGD